MKLPRIGSEAFQRGLVRTGTAVWLLTGIALLGTGDIEKWVAAGATL